MQDLKERRKKAGLTQAELARRARCSKSSIIQIEAGNLEPGGDLLERLEVGFGGKRKVKVRTEEEKELHEIFVRHFAPERKDDSGVW